MTGTAILTDLERNTYIKIPANIHAIAVRVPEANISFVTMIAVRIKNILSFFILDVMPKIKNATAVAAALHPYVAASLKVEK